MTPGAETFDKQRRLVRRLRLQGDCVKQEMPDRVGGPRLELPDPAVAREAGGVAHQPAQDGMIRVLVLHRSGREHDLRAHAADDRGELQGRRHARLEMRVAAEVGELDRRAQQFRRRPRLPGALRGRSVGRGLPPGAHHKEGGAARPGLAGNDPAAPELDVVGMSAKRQKGFRAGRHVIGGRGGSAAEGWGKRDRGAAPPDRNECGGS